MNSRSARLFLRFALAALLATSSGETRAATAPGRPLVLEVTIPLEGVRGRIDHMAVDPGRRHLIIAELGNDSADVVDLSTDRVVHRITGLREPQGVGYAKNADLIFIANAGDGAVRMFRGKDLAPAGTIRLGSDADDVRTDARDGSVVVGYGSGGLAVIDPVRRAKIADIRLAAHPEGFQIDPVSLRAFANVPDVGQIAVVDLHSHRAVDAWRVSGARANFPMALDARSSLLAVAFRSPPLLVLLDEASGAVKQRTTTCADSDDVFFDDQRRRIYVSCGGGEIDSFHVEGATVQNLATVPTTPGARTSLFVPELDRLFVASGASAADRSAAILVFRPVD